MPIVTEEMRQRVLEVLSGNQFILGENVKGFEKEFAAYCENEFCIGVNSGTSALHLALLAAGIYLGDEVITSPLSFYSTAASIIYVGARPVFVDVEPETLTIDPAKVLKLIGPKTKAIMPVHLYGHPAEMASINEIASSRGLRIIEDAAEAHGASYQGKKVGSCKDNLACFSFYPTKNITCCGDGGAAVTGDPVAAAAIRSLRNFGLNKNGMHEMLGFNMRLPELGATILRVQLKHLEEWNSRRRQIAQHYTSQITAFDVIHPSERKSSRHAYYLYVIRVSRRDELRSFLKTKGVETGVHFNPVLYQIPSISPSLVSRQKRCPIAEEASRQVVSLPMHAGLTDEQVEFVSHNVNKFYKGK
jgi:dTDP-4-amino-4,6-dideoxygalactose transaminase